MIKFIKKVLAHRQVEQAQKLWKSNFNYQLKAIHKGIEERGY